MKFVLPHGGYGLGNDLIPWAKGFILAQELGATLLHPAWGNNSRHYHRYFKTFRYDYLVYRLLRRGLPRYRFPEQDYRDLGLNDFAESCAAFMKMKGLDKKKAFIVEITGFWGAFRGLSSARSFIIASLLNTAYTQENLYFLSKHLSERRITIGVHIRLGDFRPAGGYTYAGIEQAAIPIEWYEYLFKSLETELGSSNVQWVLCSDGRPEQLGRLLGRANVTFASGLGHSDISDLLLLARSDLLICSISSYSMWAAFLSAAPYIWYRPNLVEATEGRVNRFIRSLGVNTEWSREGGVAGRAVALNTGDVLPVHLLGHLQMRRRLKDLGRDLVLGGAVAT